MVEIFAEFETVLRREAAMAIPRQRVQVLLGRGGRDLRHVRSERQEVSALVNVFLRHDVVSGVVGRIHGLGTVGNRSEFRLLQLLRPPPRWLDRRFRRRSVVSGVVLVVALYPPFSEAIRSIVYLPRHIRIEFLPPFRGYDDTHADGVPLPYDRIDRRRLQGQSGLSAVLGVAGGVRGNLPADDLGPASAGVGGHQDDPPGARCEGRRNPESVDGIERRRIGRRPGQHSTGRGGDETDDYRVVGNCRG